MGLTSSIAGDLLPMGFILIVLFNYHWNEDHIQMALIRAHLTYHAGGYENPYGSQQAKADSDVVPPTVVAHGCNRKLRSRCSQCRMDLPTGAHSFTIWQHLLP